MTRNKKYWVACGECGALFDLRKADRCDCGTFAFTWTKACPNCGNCICEKIKAEPEKFRSATEEEREEGFEFMLKERHGGAKNEK